MSESVAQEALSKAESAQAQLVAHEQLCAERYANINDKLSTIVRVLAWAGGTLFMLIIAVLGWSMWQQISAASAEQESLRETIRALQVQAQLQAASSPPARSGDSR